MISDLSGKLTDILSANGIIRNEDREIYRYGLELLISTLINIILVMTAGMVFHVLPQTILFLSEYCMIKWYAGGYHAATYARCILTFSILYASMLAVFTVFHIKETNPALAAVWLFSVAAVLVLAPVEDVNKPLEPEERRLYSKRSKQFLLLGVLINILLYLFIGNRGSLVLYALAAQIWAGSAVLAGYVKNKAGGRFDNGSNMR